MQPVKVGGPPPPFEVSMSPQAMSQRPNPYQQMPYQPTHAYYDVSRENNGGSGGNGGSDPSQQHTMYLQTNQQAYVANGHPVYPGQTTLHHHHHHPVYQTYQGDYPHPYQNVGFANQPFAHHYNMRTAIARGMGNNDDLLKSNTTSELSVRLNIFFCHYLN